MDLFLPIRFKTFVQLAPFELHKNLEDRLLKKLQQHLEGTCSRFGYIHPGSLEVTRRSAGVFMKQHFNGHIRFEMVCKALVCNPVQGTVYPAVVRQKNALGIQAESLIEGEDTPVLDIIIPRKSAGIQSEINLDTVEIGSTIYVQVLGKRFQLHDSKISIVGRAVAAPSSTASPGAGTAEDELADDGPEEGDAGMDDMEELDEDASTDADAAERAHPAEGEDAEADEDEGLRDADEDEEPVALNESGEEEEDEEEDEESDDDFEDADADADAEEEEPEADDAGSA